MRNALYAKISSDRIMLFKYFIIISPSRIDPRSRAGCRILLPMTPALRPLFQKMMFLTTVLHRKAKRNSLVRHDT